MDFIFKYIFSSVFAGFGLFILIIIYAPLRKKNYNPVLATIINNSKYEKYFTQRGTITYGVRLEYEYQVAGKNYTNKRIFKNSDSYGSSDPAWAIQFENEYPVGKSITIFVNKDNPSDAYILDKSPGTLFFTFLAMLAVVGGILIWYFN